MTEMNMRKLLTTKVHKICVVDSRKCKQQKRLQQWTSSSYSYCYLQEMSLILQNVVAFLPYAYVCYIFL